MQVVWTFEVRKQIEDALTYCRITFGVKVTIRFSEELKKQGVLLGAFPLMGKVEPLLEGRNHEYRSHVVHKLFKLVYYIEGDTVFIVDIWNVRRNPKHLVKKLR